MATNTQRLNGNRKEVSEAEIKRAIRQADMDFVDKMVEKDPELNDLIKTIKSSVLRKNDDDFKEALGKALRKAKGIGSAEGCLRPRGYSEPSSGD